MLSVQLGSLTAVPLGRVSTSGDGRARAARSVRGRPDPPSGVERAIDSVALVGPRVTPQPMTIGMVGDYGMDGDETCGARVCV